MLAAFANPKTLGKLLADPQKYRPYPSISERLSWQELPRSLRCAIVAAAEETLGKPWPLLPASLYLDFMRTGKRKPYEEPYFARRSRLLRLVLAECIEDRGRFLDDIANGICSMSEESSWCVPAHIAVQKAGCSLPDVSEPVIDLFAAESGALLAWARYLLRDRLDKVSSLLQPRILLEVERRVLTPFLQRDDFWWMGLQGQRVNNWNPWIIANVIFCCLLSEKDNNRRLKIIAKAMRCLDGFLATYPADGGCDEGPAYWGRAAASLFECLEALYRASGGAIDLYGKPLIREMGRFIYRVHIADRWFINFADAPAVMLPEGALIYWFGRRIGDQVMAQFGRWCAQQRQEIFGHIASPQRVLMSIFSWKELRARPAEPPLPRDIWLPEVQVMVARAQSGSCHGLTVAAKGGHNAESHNHNDVGNFVAYADGQPVLIDVGVETYTRKTFSCARYEIWTMQSQYHNLPTVNKVMQSDGRQFSARNVAYSAGGAKTEFSLDLAPAYPPAAGIKTWRRRLTLERPQTLTVEDAYELTRTPRDIFLSLMTPCRPRLGKGKILLASRLLPAGRRSGTARLEFDWRELSARCEPIAIGDAYLANIWGSRLWRLILTPRRKRVEGRITIRLIASNS